MHTNNKYFLNEAIEGMGEIIAENSIMQSLKGISNRLGVVAIAHNLSTWKGDVRVLNILVQPQLLRRFEASLATQNPVAKQSKTKQQQQQKQRHLLYIYVLS